MAFATKNDLMNWVRDNLKTGEDAELIDPIDADKLEPVKRKSGWTFIGKPESWFWQVEDLNHE